MAMATTLRVLILCAVSGFLPNCSSFVPAANNSLSKALRLGRQFDRRSRRDDEETREEFLRRPLAGIVLAAPAAARLLRADAANAAETPAEAIRLLSAKSIPGLGPPDVYYPPYFVGKWRVTRVVSNSDDNFWNGAKENGLNLPVKFVSEMRFVPYDAGKDFTGDDNPNDVPAIADRSFNERSCYASLSEELNALSAKKAMPAIQSLNWTPTNPNVLSLAYADGSSKEVKVTKRSSDVSKDGKALFSSEFRRVTAVPPSSGSVAGGIPQIYKSRLLTKWKEGGTNNDGGRVDLIEGIEILYNEQGVMGDRTDPLLGGTSIFNDGKNSEDVPDWRSTKTKILMERIVG